MHFYVSGLGTLVGHLTKLSTSVKSSCVVSLFPVAICRKRHFLQINTLEVGKPYLSYAIYHLFSKELSQLRFSFLTLSFCLCCPRRYFQDFENWRPLLFPVSVKVEIHCKIVPIFHGENWKFQRLLQLCRGYKRDLERQLACCIDYKVPTSSL